MSPAFISFTWLLARGGGGGSSGGGGGGSIIELPLIIIIAILAFWWRHHRMKQARKAISMADQTDTSWDPGSLKQRVSEVFTQFENDWSRFDVEAMTPYVTKTYRQRMVLELSVLQQMGRQNILKNLALHAVNFIGVDDEPGEDQDEFTAEIRAKADDYLVDKTNNKTLYLDTKPFKEYWTFRRDNGIWKLHEISQYLPARDHNEQVFEDLVGLSHAADVQVKQFADANKFFYDADFGRLILPKEGALFKGAKFASSNIDDHVIGLSHNVIVQFYRYVPVPSNRGQVTFTIAQAVLPKQYGDIMVKRRHLFDWPPRGMHKASLEDPIFNKHFRVWATDLDRIPSLELLTPNFMEKLLTLKFELNIEVVGQTLYFFTKSARIDYQQMLEVLEWAFQEMRM